ncbi:MULTISPECIES: plasmid mobilization relaxosome protein MobC [Campylobacter]|uniref:plasmid mobilization relaxosome protein MobC n=1 Tax=Campylobacter TaxID=194 RepID=UPI0023F36A76|nr:MULTISPECIES: plasmid mobilization relaxosome protein MobC [Campylobacter]MCI6641483.1 plasmid mobilization relaxosome protein MobC [Campylobacter sp.]MDD7422163.1 plasmid mobilization relaxosome protein MobC [Campylobacter hominis]MDY3117824.1 plasmid mobilization relaxosome protein MobC [Campylobacter hominis]
MTKRKGHFIYFTEADARILTKLANGRNESKSAVVRKLIQIAKYKDTLVEIENHNKLLKDFLKEFALIGTNINQIAYHLNANIINNDEAKTDMEKNIIKLNQTINKISKKLENLKININVEHIKTPNESKREENG